MTYSVPVGVEPLVNPCDAYCTTQAGIGYNEGILRGAAQFETVGMALFIAMMISLICKTLLTRKYRPDQCIGNDTKMKIRKVIMYIDGATWGMALTLSMFIFMWSVLGYTGVTVNAGAGIPIT